MNDSEKEGLRISSYGGKTNSATVDNLGREGLEVFRGSILGGHHWIRRSKDGGLESVPSFEELPEAKPDEGMLPYWPRAEDVTTQEVMFFPGDEKERVGGFSSPSISIQSLCGYNYSKENYEREKLKLESFGFSQMRSKRGDDGGYWEMWYLCGLFSAKGGLKEYLEKEKKSDKKELDLAISFLCKNVSFGTLDVSVQRAAMVID